MSNKIDRSSEEFKIHGDWEKQSQELKKEYPQLSDADLEFKNGKKVEMLERMESRLNKSREEVIRIINDGQPI